MSKSRSLNRVTLIGNLTRDPVLRETSSGVMIASFGIATNTSWKDKNGEYREKAEYHNLVAFNKLAEICVQVLSLGMLVYLEGELRNKVVVDPDGRKQYRSEIKLNDMFILDSKGKKGVGFDNVKREDAQSDEYQEANEYSADAVTPIRDEKLVDNSSDIDLKSEDLF